MEKKIQFQELEIYYKIYGSGQPVVLLHGFAEDSDIWSEQVSFLQQYCMLLVPDLPVSGKSGRLQKNDAVIDDYAACVNALLANEKIEKCILLGHSMGGYITLAFAERFPEKLKGFGFVHSTAFADSNEKKAAREKGIRMLEEYGVYAFLKNTTPNLFSANYKRQYPERVSQLIEKGKDFSKEALIQYYRAMMYRPDRTYVLAKSTVPVLFIIGSEDTAAPPADLIKQVHLPKIAHVHIIVDVGHMGMWEDPEKLNTYLLDFIRDAS